MMMIYEYKCGHCENVQEGMRSVANREDAPVCNECGKETSLIISIAGGFKISGGGVYSSGFSSRTGKGRYKFAEGVGPLDKRSKAYQKKQDDDASRHYGPGQSCSMDSKEFKKFSQTRDGMDQGRSRFDK
jgi:putative FmdB family regulatory protein